MASTTLARTQPLVVQPATSKVSTPLGDQEGREIGAKEGRGLRLADDQSPGAGASAATTWLATDFSVEVAQPGRLLAPDARIGSVLGIDDAREDHRALLARKNPAAGPWRGGLGMLPPPRMCGSGKPFTKSTTSSAGRLPKPLFWPNCCRDRYRHRSCIDHRDRRPGDQSRGARDGPVRIDRETSHSHRPLSFELRPLPGSVQTPADIVGGTGSRRAD